MSHPEQMAFVAEVKKRLPSYFIGRSVLEVGSLDINGSVRPLFEDCAYLGIDLGPGPGVDLVCHLLELPEEAGAFEVVISCEALEHDARWAGTVPELWRRLLPGGLLVITCAGPGRLPHGLVDRAPECSPFTLDYYRGLSAAELHQVLGVPATWSVTEVDVGLWALKS